jgi:Tat protein secretion system quality control protein TatD with DNase activity
VIIDAHVHLSGGVFPGDERAGEVTLLHMMDRALIDMAVVLGLQPEDNPDIISAAARHRDRLIPFIVPVIGPGTPDMIDLILSR